jgi:hypothetical protein
MGWLIHHISVSHEGHAPLIAKTNDSSIFDNQSITGLNRYA